MQKRSIFSILLVTGMLTVGTACVSADAQKKGDARMAQTEQAIKDADASRKKAASVSGEWRDTGKMIKSAQKALKAGDYDKAMKLAKKAHQQGQLGYEQAVSQNELRMPAYLKY